MKKLAFLGRERQGFVLHATKKTGFLFLSLFQIVAQAKNQRHFIAIRLGCAAAQNFATDAIIAKPFALLYQTFQVFIVERKAETLPKISLQTYTCLQSDVCFTKNTNLMLRICIGLSAILQLTVPAEKSLLWVILKSRSYIGRKRKGLFFRPKTLARF
jgi:hypothetical protein